MLDRLRLGSRLFPGPDYEDNLAPYFTRVTVQISEGYRTPCRVVSSAGNSNLCWLAMCDPEIPEQTGLAIAADQLADPVA